MSDFENRIIGMIQMKSLELHAKGYSLEQAQAAIKRSRRWSSSMSSKLPSHLRDEAFLSFFEDSLKESEEWLDSLVSSLTK